MAYVNSVHTTTGWSRAENFQYILRSVPGYFEATLKSAPVYTVPSFPVNWTSPIDSQAIASRKPGEF